MGVVVDGWAQAILSPIHFPLSFSSCICHPLYLLLSMSDQVCAVHVYLRFLFSRSGDI